MGLQFEKVVEDARGKIFFLSYHDKKINIVEIKKGFARGGHYHPSGTAQTILTGKIEYREENIESGKERIEIITAPSSVSVPSKTAHLLIALEDTVFVEAFDKQYTATNYDKYRKIVEEKMNSESSQNNKFISDRVKVC